MDVLATLVLLIVGLALLDIIIDGLGGVANRVSRWARRGR